MSPRAKSRPDRSCLKYTRSSNPGGPGGKSRASVIVASSRVTRTTARFRLRRQRFEPRHQLLDLGPRLTQPLVQLVDERRCPLQPRHQDVDVDLTLFEEVHDRIELAARLGVAQLVDGHGGRRVVSSHHHATPLSFVPSVSTSTLSTSTGPASTPSTVLRTLPSANLVTICWPEATSLARRTKVPSAVMVSEYPRSSWRSTSYAATSLRHAPNRSS